MKTTTNRAPKGTPTGLNIRTMASHFAGKDRASNRVSPTSDAGLRRCLKAGLFTVDGAELVLTDAGRAALANV